MSSRFWNIYAFFFAFVFPLFFSFAGEEIWLGWAATLALIVGFFGWVWLVVMLFRYYRKNPKTLYKEALQVKRNGKLAEATILQQL